MAAAIGAQLGKGLGEEDEMDERRPLSFPCWGGEGV